MNNSCELVNNNFTPTINIVPNIYASNNIILIIFRKLNDNGCYGTQEIFENFNISSKWRIRKN